MENLISVIIPVYNAERHLNKCLNSLIVQTYSNIEIILIDDGSTDSSGIICDRYAEKNDNIIVIHKKNEGVAIARNVGIEKCIGNYVLFVDSDDYLTRTSVESMATCIGDADWLITSYIAFRNSFLHRTILRNTEELSKNNFCNRLDQLNAYIDTPWAKLYRADIIKNNNIRFDNRISIGEDTRFNIKYLSEIQTIKITSDICYCYRLGGIASTTTYHENIGTYYYDMYKYYKKYLLTNNTIDYIRKKGYDLELSAMLHHVYHLRKKESLNKIIDTINIWQAYNYTFCSYNELLELCKDKRYNEILENIYRTYRKKIYRKKFIKLLRKMRR